MLAVVQLSLATGTTEGLVGILDQLQSIDPMRRGYYQHLKDTVP